MQSFMFSLLPTHPRESVAACQRYHLATTAHGTGPHRKQTISFCKFNIDTTYQLKRNDKTRFSTLLVLNILPLAPSPFQTVSKLHGKLLETMWAARAGCTKRKGPVHIRTTKQLRRRARLRHCKRPSEQHGIGQVPPWN